MPRLKLLLFDANVVIELHRLGLWGKVIDQCDIYLTRTVAYDESQFWEDDCGQRYYFDLNNDIENGKIECIDISNLQLSKFFAKFSPVYLEKLDPGEAESLALLVLRQEKWLISSADIIVYKVLGSLAMGDRGVSLEEVLISIGMKRNDLDWQYTRRFREKYTKKGERDGITGLGLSGSP